MHRSLYNTRNSRQRLVVVFLHTVYKASCDSRSYRLSSSNVSVLLCVHTAFAVICALSPCAVYRNVCPIITSQRALQSPAYTKLMAILPLSVCLSHSCTMSKRLNIILVLFRPMLRRKLDDKCRVAKLKLHVSGSLNFFYLTKFVYTTFKNDFWNVGILKFFPKSLFKINTYCIWVNFFNLLSITEIDEKAIRVIPWIIAYETGPPTVSQNFGGMHPSTAVVTPLPLMLALFRYAIKIPSMQTTLYGL